MYAIRSYYAIKQSEINDDKLTTKGVFTDLNCTINGFKFVFGVGGIHGSVESQIVYSDDDFQIVDVDVTSFYRITSYNVCYTKLLRTLIFIESI